MLLSAQNRNIDARRCLSILAVRPIVFQQPLYSVIVIRGDYGNYCYLLIGYGNCPCSTWSHSLVS